MFFFLKFFTFLIRLKEAIANLLSVIALQFLYPTCKDSCVTSAKKTTRDGEVSKKGISNNVIPCFLS